MFDLPWSTLLAAALIVMLSYAVYGLTGFGAVIVGLPLLAHFFPLRFAVPLMLVFDISVGLLLGWRNHHLVDWQEMKRLLPYLLVGMLVGVYFLAQVPEGWLLMVLGAFVLGYATWNFRKKPADSPASAHWASAAGLFGGAFTAMYGTGGPIYVIYLSRRLRDTRVLRATIGVLIFGTALLRLVLFTGSGFYAQDNLLTLGVALLPCVMLGYLIGNLLHSRIQMQHAIQIIWLLLILSGASLIWRSMHLI